MGLFVISELSPYWLSYGAKYIIYLYWFNDNITLWDYTNIVLIIPIKSLFHTQVRPIYKQPNSTFNFTRASPLTNMPTKPTLLFYVIYVLFIPHTL